MSLWRTILSAFCAAPTLPLHHTIREANRGRREVSDFAARVHSAAQVSALDIINDAQRPVDTLDAWVKGQDADGR